ncbi:CHAT domain-containing protein [Cylindrospermopsis raciborskii C04]|uniref:CHAT domain-containing protein n=1 Tax=Cylindrospermopsis raciborskii C07 TaxID=2014886 RepID=A0ABX4WNK2_9CYAN|nr:CHAT domain-containing protein [Cylindrospermopsis raciborskii]PNJ96822.1 CHAT domain-containing protein [Cylindrospermopsis raciborskii C04]PNJ96842.1 CHAT domain-containing protein [Cylindrospermopsis raciborskii C03]PNJ99983.1 CHAT domain-containing protein [Cylindrospermopsis raciborskii C07]
MNQGRTYDYIDLIELLIGTIFESKGDSQVIYPLLENNLHLLDATFIDQLQSWGGHQVNKQATPEQNAQLGASLYLLARIFYHFPGGDPLINLAIAICGYEFCAAIERQLGLEKELAQVLNHLGAAYQTQAQMGTDSHSNLEKAIAAYNEAITIRRQPGLERELAQVLNNLGAAYQIQAQMSKEANLERAVTAYAEAISILRELDLERDLAQTLYNLGSAYQTQAQLGKDSQANLQKAIPPYTEAISILRELGLERDLAKTLTSVGSVYISQGKLERAITPFREAITMFRQLGLERDLAETLNQLGSAYLSEVERGRDPEANLQRAIIVFTKALTILRQPGLESDLAQTLHNLGKAYQTQAELGTESQSNLEMAIAHYREALAIATPELSPADYLKFASHLGDLGFEQGWWDIALEGYEQGIKALETIQFWKSGDKSLGEIQHPHIYQSAVRACIELHQYGKAVELVERSKSRNLVELLENKHLYPKGNIPSRIYGELDRLRQAIRNEVRLLEIQGEKRSHGQLNTLIEELDQFITSQVKPLDPHFSLTQRVEPITISKILKLVGADPRRVILEWYFTDDVLYTFIITANPDVPIFPHKVVISPSVIRQFSQKYLDIYRDRHNLGNWKQALPELLGELKEILQVETLLTQLWKLSPPCEELVLIPYGCLHIFPLHALFPWERFPLGFSYFPSCQLLSSVGVTEREEVVQSLAIQNPTQNLQYASFEVETIITRLLIGTEVITEKEATRETIFSRSIPEKNYLHFSCTGYSNFQKPLHSAILLANCILPAPPKGGEYLPLPNGAAVDLSQCLTLGDICGLDMRRCHLVSLSAYEMGIGDMVDTKNDDYISLPTGFLLAGASTIISSLWAVSDYTTALLMIRFYQFYTDTENLLTYGCPRLALYHAQQWLRDAPAGKLLTWAAKLPFSGTRLTLLADFDTMPESQRPFQEPYYWAAFTCVGI